MSEENNIERLQGEINGLRVVCEALVQSMAFRLVPWAQ